MRLIAWYVAEHSMHIALVDNRQHPCLVGPRVDALPTFHSWMAGVVLCCGQTNELAMLSDDVAADDFADDDFAATTSKRLRRGSQFFAKSD